MQGSAVSIAATLHDVEIAEVAADSDALREVIILSKQAKRWLGFLPDAGFRDRAVRGTLLAAVVSRRVVAYALYDLPADRVKLVHLCVGKEDRGRGLGRILVDAVSERHHDRRGVELACRRDFPAHRLWPALGFRPIVDRLGRGHDGRLLAVWFLDHGHPDLLSIGDPARAVAAVDHNVFQDLVTDREQGETSRHLLDPWVRELVQLAISDQVSYEINDCKDDRLRQRMLTSTAAFRHLESGADWTELVPTAASAAPRAQPGDHRHVAMAAAAGATYFVTRDDELARAAKPVERALRLALVRPEELITRLDRLRSGGGYEPEALHATSIVQVGASDAIQDAFVGSLLNHGAGERAAALRTLVREALATPDLHEFKLFLDADRRAVAGLIWAIREGELDVIAIRVRAADVLGASIARQLAFLARREAAERKLPRVVLSDKCPSAAVLPALADEGYVQAGGQWTCAVETGVVKVSPALQSPPNEGSLLESAAARERAHWPLKVVGAGIPSYLVPIHPTWAAQLFDPALAESTLFGRELALGLSREHVYYRRPSNSGGLARPARILWYVRGGTRGHPTGAVRAVSQVAEVVVGRPKTLYQRYARLGVYNEQQVLDAADSKGRVMAIRFVNSEPLEQPVTLEALRRIHDEERLSFSIRSPRLVPERMFCLIYARGSRYAR